MARDAQPGPDGRLGGGGVGNAAAAADDLNRNRRPTWEPAAGIGELDGANVNILTRPDSFQWKWRHGDKPCHRFLRPWRSNPKIY